MFGFRRNSPQSLASYHDYCPRKIASCWDCTRDSASCRESGQEGESREQFRQEGSFHVQQSHLEARDRGQFRRKPNMTDDCGGLVFILLVRTQLS